MKGIEGRSSLVNLALEFMKFGIVGLSNTAISLSIYYLFIYISKNLYLLGNTVGFVVSVLNSYYWNNKYVFKKNQKDHLKPLLKTLAAYFTTFTLSTVLLFVIVHYLNVSEVIAPLINLMITVPLNFLLNKFWAMK